jgi:hypothetical protein
MFELHRARTRTATDPRDYVFALLGHFSAKSGPEDAPLIEADYSLNMEEVSHRVAYRSLEVFKDLTALNVVQYSIENKGNSRDV